MPREDFRFAHPLRVRWVEVDRQGVVFNGNYLMYFDVAVTEYYRATGLSYPGALEELGSDLFTRRAEVEYFAPAHYDDELEICVRVARLGRTSLEFRLEVYRGHALLASGALVYVNADPAARRAVPLPDSLRRTLLEFEGLSPEADPD